MVAAYMSGIAARNIRSPGMAGAQYGPSGSVDSCGEQFAVVG